MASHSFQLLVAQATSTNIPIFSDSFIHAILSTLDPDQPYIILYTTTPPNAPLTPPLYSTDDNYDAVLHTEFKRDAAAHPGAVNASANAPLFEKYAFLSPGKY
jgi:hypothetical protein